MPHLLLATAVSAVSAGNVPVAAGRVPESAGSVPVEGVEGSPEEEQQRQKQSPRLTATNMPRRDIRDVDSVGTPGTQAVAPAAQEATPLIQASNQAAARELVKPLVARLVAAGVGEEVAEEEDAEEEVAEEEVAEEEVTEEEVTEDPGSDATEKEGE